MQKEDAIQGGRRADDLSPRLLDRGPFLARLTRVVAEHGEREQPRLWVKVFSFPSLHLLSASFPADVIDDVVREIVGLVERTWPDAAALGRLPGNELVVAAFGPRPRDLVAERYGDRVAPLLLNVRSGACVHVEGDDAEELLRKARLAHFVACRAPGRAAEVYDDAMARQVGEEADLLRHLLPAIDGGELALEYQPQVDLETRRLVGVEALVRWPQQEGPSRLPDRFIWAAEQSGVVVRLGQWALFEACRQAAAWRDAGCAPFRVAVNLSPLHFFRAHVATDVRRALETHDLAADWLELELTESAILGDDGVGADVLEELAGMGLTIALDDFGTGQSSLSRLWRLPIHRLKIDRAFVQSCPGADGDRCLVSAIAGIGASLRMQVLAEGVETEEQLRFVSRAGCHEAQGHLFAPSLAPGQLLGFLREQGSGEG